MTEWQKAQKLVFPWKIIMLQEYSLKISNLQYFSRRFGRFSQSISTIRKSCTQLCTHCYWMIPNPKLILVESH